MAKLKLKSGDIYQIPLPKNLGFAYVKYVDLTEIEPACGYPAIIRVFNYRSLDNSTEGIDFKDKQLLFSPLLIAGAFLSVKEKTWKLVTNIPLSIEEAIIPHYKFPEPPVLLDEENAKEWFYALNANKFSRKINARYDDVKHLETLSATGSDIVGTKIAMGLLKDEGKEIKDYFSLEEFYEKFYYNEVTKIPAYYKQPKEMQGRALNSEK
jgi:hypothetical protein